MKQVIAEVNHHIPVLRQGFDRLLRDLGGLLIVALEAEISLFLAKYLWFLEHVAGGAAEPRCAEVEIVRFNCGVHSSGNDQGILGREGVALFISCLGLLELAASGIQIPKRKVGNVQRRIGLCQALEVLFRGLVATRRARSISERNECEAIVGVDGQNPLIDIDRILGAPEFHQDVAVELQAIRVSGIHGERILYVAQRSVEVAAHAF